MNRVTIPALTEHWLCSAAASAKDNASDRAVSCPFHFEDGDLVLDFHIPRGWCFKEPPAKSPSRPSRVVQRLLNRRPGRVERFQSND